MVMAIVVFFVVTSKMLRKYNYIFKWLRVGCANDIK